MPRRPPGLAIGAGGAAVAARSIPRAQPPRHRTASLQGAEKDEESAPGQDRGPCFVLLTWTTDYFKRAGIDSARLDAEVLLAHALDVDRLRLYIDHEKPVEAKERDRYRALVQRRAQGACSGLAASWGAGILVAVVQSDLGRAHTSPRDRDISGMGAFQGEGCDAQRGGTSCRF